MMQFSSKLSDSRYIFHGSVSDFELIKDLYKKYEASGRPISKPFHEARYGSEDGTQR